MPLSDAVLEQISVVLAQSDPDYRVVQRLAKTVREACEVEFDCRAARDVQLEWLRKRLAEEDTGGALLELGLHYAKGTGVAQDRKKAAALFQQAADLKVPEAQCELGCCYANGFGVDQNYGRAVALFRQSIANTDHPEAHFELGCCYMEGLGVKEDLRLAAFHLDCYLHDPILDESTAKRAQRMLEDCRDELRQVAIARQQEAEWKYRNYQETFGDGQDVENLTSNFARVSAEDQSDYESDSESEFQNNWRWDN